MSAVLRAEWTKLRTVRGWAIGLVVAALLPVVFALSASGMHGSCDVAACDVPVGPDGEEVADSFYFVHRPLSGDGSITARVSTPDTTDGDHRVRVPWAKAGIIVKETTTPGAGYAAMMLTGGHGARMQYAFTHDLAGPAGARWLRLTRSGSTVTGAASADGVRWTTVGTARLRGSTLQAGLFAASPDHMEVNRTSVESGPALATATFSAVGTAGAWGGDWAGTRVGGPVNAAPELRGGFERSGGVFTVRGSGDIAPNVPPAGLGVTVAQALGGTFAGLLLVVVLAAMFMTAEYRRGLIRITLAASPWRGRVLLAKAAVVGLAGFGAGLVGTAIALPLGRRLLQGNGVHVFPVSAGTELRVIVGTAAMIGVAAVMALAIGSLLRRGALSVAVVIAAIVLPYLLAISVLPDDGARWLLRLTPAAAYAVQGTVPQYAQVRNVYSPANGYFPLPPWAGLGVLCGWAALALVLAAVMLRRRDA
jgi:hypothetical protein